MSDNILINVRNNILSNGVFTKLEVDSTIWYHVYVNVRGRVRTNQDNVWLPVFRNIKHKQVTDKRLEHAYDRVTV